MLFKFKQFFPYRLQKHLKILSYPCLIFRHKILLSIESHFNLQWRTFIQVYVECNFAQRKKLRKNTKYTTASTCNKQCIQETANITCFIHNKNKSITRGTLKSVIHILSEEDDLTREAFNIDMIPKEFLYGQCKVLTMKNASIDLVSIIHKQVSVIICTSFQVLTIYYSHMKKIKKINAKWKILNYL